MNISGKGFSQESSSAAKEIVKTIPWLFDGPDHRAKATV